MQEVGNVIFGGAILSSIIGFWDKIRSGITSIFGVAIETTQIHDHGLLRDEIINELVKYHKVSRLYTKVFDYKWDNVSSLDGKSCVIPYEQYGKLSTLFWVGGFPLWVGIHDREEVNNAAALPAPTGMTPGGSNDKRSSDKQVGMTLRCIRGTIDVEAMVQRCAKNREDRCNMIDSASKERRFDIFQVASDGNILSEKNSSGTMSAFTPFWVTEHRFRLIGYSRDDVRFQEKMSDCLLDYLVFNEDVERVINQVKFWSENKKWYIKHHIPWKYGLLLYGKPGTGKSSLAFALGEYLNYPVFVYRLGEMTNRSFTGAWAHMKKMAPCIALFEDIDNVFNQRENVMAGSSGLAQLMRRPSSMHQPGQPVAASSNESSSFLDGFGGVSFDTLLQCLDGVDRSGGVVTIITTNKIESIDEALGAPVHSEDNDFRTTRPGRMDKAVCMNKFTIREKMRMADHILGEFVDLKDKIARYLHENPEVDETPAQFQAKCIDLAKNKMEYNKEKSTPLKATASLDITVPAADKYEGNIQPWYKA